MYVSRRAQGRQKYTVMVNISPTSVSSASFFLHEMLTNYDGFHLLQLQSSSSRTFTKWKQCQYTRDIFRLNPQQKTAGCSVVAQHWHLHCVTGECQTYRLAGCGVPRGGVLHIVGGLCLVVTLVVLHPLARNVLLFGADAAHRGVSTARQQTQTHTIHF